LAATAGSHGPNVLTPQRSALPDPWFILKFLTFSNVHKAGAFLLQRNRVLLVRSRGAKWGFPKGFILPGETALSCATRKVKDQTSLDVDIAETDRLAWSPGQTVIYFKEIKETTRASINTKVINCKDCTGICWVRLSCLKKEVLANNNLFASPLRSVITYYL
jgi:hypothetical protein